MKTNIKQNKRVLRFKLSNTGGKNPRMAVHEIGEYVYYRDYKLLSKNLQTQINQHKKRINDLLFSMEEMEKELIALRNTNK